MKTQSTPWSAIFLALLAAGLPVASQGTGQRAGAQSATAASPSARAAPRTAAIPRTAGDINRPAATATIRSLDRIPQMVSEVNASAVMATIEYLEGFQTRYASTPNLELAGDYLYHAFSDLGLQVERDPFTVGLLATNNIIATLPGTTDPSTVVIVGAHYDSTSNQRWWSAPGADDDASGVGVLVELARVLRNYQFDFTIKFIAFSAEEGALYGSYHYAWNANFRREKILAMVELDMVGYVDREPEDLDLHVNESSAWLVDAFADAASRYAPLPTRASSSSEVRGNSDQAAFWDYGYSAVLVIDDIPLTNPNYHKTTDTSSTLSTDFLGAVARTTLATVAMLAQPGSAPAPPANVRVSSPRVVRGLFLHPWVASLTWNASASRVAGYNVYRSTRPRGAYQRINRSPVTGTSFADRTMPGDGTYYYVVTAVDATGTEGNASGPAAMRMAVR